MKLSFLAFSSKATFLRTFSQVPHTALPPHTYPNQPKHDSRLPNTSTILLSHTTMANTPAPSPKRYSGATALHFFFRDHENASSNSAALKEAWEEYDYDVVEVDESMMGLKKTMTEEERSTAAEKWLRDWMEENWLG